MTVYVWCVIVTGYAVMKSGPQYLPAPHSASLNVIKDLNILFMKFVFQMGGRLSFVLLSYSP